MLGMIATFAQLEADMVSERTKDAFAAVKAQGKRLGAPSMVDLGAIESVRLVKDLQATERYTPRSLADELNRRGLNRRGVSTAKGGRREVVTDDGACRVARQRVSGAHCNPVAADRP
jgi:DNA invertase Pin-like site-specific DNA recombinase